MDVGVEPPGMADICSLQYLHFLLPCRSFHGVSLLDVSDSYFRLKKTSPKLATSVYTDNEFYINGRHYQGI